MVAFPGCKINLGLHILRRRPDGYHDIDTAFYPVPWSDFLEFLPARELAFTCTGLEIPGERMDNLCLRAYRLLKQDHSLPPVQGHLHKLVPMGAGLGGGSADAAHTLRLLNAIFSLSLTPAQLADYARRLGSDCSYFLMNQPARGTGRGDILEPLSIDLRGFYLVVVTPPVHVSTAVAYAGVEPKLPEEPLHITLARPVDQWKTTLRNDFESTVFSRYPQLAEVKGRLYDQGAVYASLSGSGSSLYGLFRSAISRASLFADMLGWSGWL